MNVGFVDQKNCTNDDDDDDEEMMPLLRAHQEEDNEDDDEEDEEGEEEYRWLPASQDEVAPLLQVGSLDIINICVNEGIS